MQVEPNATVAAWLADEVSAAQQVAEGLEWETGGWVVGVLVALGLVRKFAPALGPAGAAIGNAIGMLARVFLPKESREAEQRMAVAEETLWRIVEVIEIADPQNPVIKELKKAIKDKSPSEFHALFKAWKDTRHAVQE
jgi:hypothetical protein